MITEPTAFPASRGCAFPCSGARLGGRGIILPSFVGAGTPLFTTTGGNVPLPQSLADGQLMLLSATTANQAVATPTGYTATTTPTGFGTGGTAGAVLLSHFHRVASGESVPALADPGDVLVAIIAAFSGVDPADPIHKIAHGTLEVAGTSLTFPAVTTEVDNCLIVNIAAIDLDLGTNNTVFSGWTNASLASITEGYDRGSATGAGGGLAMAYGRLATAGASGQTTVTLANSTVAAMTTIALTPAG